MSIDAVRPLVVTPKHDSKDQARRDHQNNEHRRPRKDEQDGFSNTLRNTLGQSIGQTINLVA
jgi:hypothetical protein